MFLFFLLWGMRSIRTPELRPVYSNYPGNYNGTWCKYQTANSQLCEVIDANTVVNIVRLAVTCAWSKTSRSRRRILSSTADNSEARYISSVIVALLPAAVAARRQHTCKHHSNNHCCSVNGCQSNVVYLQYINNKCIRDDTKAAARQSLNCSKNKK